MYMHVIETKICDPSRQNGPYRPELLDEIINMGMQQARADTFR